MTAPRKRIGWLAQPCSYFAQPVHQCLHETQLGSGWSRQTRRLAAGVCATQRPGRSPWCGFMTEFWGLNTRLSPAGSPRSSPPAPPALTALQPLRSPAPRSPLCAGSMDGRVEVQLNAQRAAAPSASKPGTVAGAAAEQLAPGAAPGAAAAAAGQPQRDPTSVLERCQGSSGSGSSAASAATPPPPSVGECSAAAPAAQRAACLCRYWRLPALCSLSRGAR